MNNYADQSLNQITDTNIILGTKIGSERMT